MTYIPVAVVSNGHKTDIAITDKNRLVMHVGSHPGIQHAETTIDLGPATKRRIDEVIANFEQLKTLADD